MKDKRILEIINNATVKDGVKLFTFDHFVDTCPRPVAVGGASGSEGSGLPPRSADSSEESEASPDHAAAGGNTGEVTQRWRLISAVQAWPSMGWMPALVDYAHEGGKALKHIKPIVNAVSPDLMKNHTDDVNAIVGRIQNASWEDSTDIPPGVNADLAIDPQFDAKAAYALKNGIYRSGSIGITGQFKKSHEKMDDYEFMTKQGEKVDGEVVRWLPVKITGVRHMAIVAKGHGADPNSGPRDENASHKGALNTESSAGGSLKMFEQLWGLFNEVLSLLKLDKLIDNTTLPDGIVQKVKDRIGILNQALERVAWLEAQLQSFGDLLKTENEAGLTSEEVLNRLPDTIQRAKNGDAYLKHRRAEALKWFDSAKVDPDKKEFSDLDKKLRALIENSTDLEFIELQAAHYEEIATQRLGLNRSSQPEKLPPETDAAKKAKHNPKIATSAGKMFGGGEKK